MPCTRPDMQKGDWLRPLAGFGSPKSPTPRFYLLSPSENRPETLLPPEQIPTLYADTSYFGPVHVVQNTPQFATCLVPHPDRRETGLVWLNIWTRDRGGHMYCRVVPEPTRAAWRHAGWRNRYRPLPTLTLQPV